MSDFTKKLDEIKILIAAQVDESNAWEGGGCYVKIVEVFLNFQLQHVHEIMDDLKNPDNVVQVAIKPRLGRWNEPQMIFKKWVYDLADGISRLVNVQASVGKETYKVEWGPETVLHFRGYKHDVELAKYIMEYTVHLLKFNRSELKRTYTYKLQGYRCFNEQNEALVGAIVGELRDGIKEMSMFALKTPEAKWLKSAKRLAVFKKFGLEAYKPLPIKGYQHVKL